MTRFLNAVLMFFVVLLLAACNTPPPKYEVVKAANYGAKPSKDKMVAAAKRFMSERLIDPYSAVYACTTPIRSWIIGGTSGNVESGRIYFGYSSHCTINAKNRLGGYTGNKKYLFMISELEQNGQYYFYHFDGYQDYQALESIQ